MSTITIQLSEDQQIAENNILDWIEASKEAQFSLIGYAGTGKTFLVGQLINRIKRNGLRVCIAAPTHKAKEVLQEKCGFTDAYTSAGLIGLAPDEGLENFDPLKLEFMPKFDSKVNDYDIIIHDESSMLPPKYHEYLVDECVRCSAKVIFVGDDAQLPPIKSTKETEAEIKKYGYILRDSPALLCEDNAVLSQVIRQGNDNPLSYLLLALRLDIDFHRGRNQEKKVYDSFVELLPQQYHNILEGIQRGRFVHRIIANIGQDLNADGKGFTFIRQQSEFDAAITHVTDEIRDKIMSRAVAFTNDRVRELNLMIRKGLIDAPAENGFELLPGESVMGYNTIRDANLVNIVTNSKEYVIKKVGKPYEDLHGYKVVEVNFENHGPTLIVLHPDSYPQYLKEYMTRLNAGRAKKQGAWKAYYSFKNSYILFDDLSKKFNNKEYPKKDFDYSYAITTHKSQGSTYKTVLVDMNNMLPMIDINKGDKTDFYRMLYVAASRASHQAIFYIKK